MTDKTALKLQFPLPFLFGFNQSIAEQWGGPPLLPAFEFVVI